MFNFNLKSCWKEVGKLALENVPKAGSILVMHIRFGGLRQKISRINFAHPTQVSKMATYLPST